MLALELELPRSPHGPFQAHPYPGQLPGAFGPFPAAGRPWWCRQVFRLPSGTAAMREGWCPQGWAHRAIRVSTGVGAQRIR